WSASGIFGAASEAINDAWDIRKGRPFIQQYTLNITLVVAAGFFLFVSIGLTAFFRVFSIMAGPLLEPFPINVLWWLVSALLPFLSTLAVFLIIYKILPYTRVAWRGALVGAVVASLLFEIAKNVFSWYTQNLANYNLVYGSIGTVVVLLTWIYFSSVILLLGAELSSVYTVWRPRMLMEKRAAKLEPQWKPSPALALAVGILTISMTIIKSIAYWRAERSRK
ncbi:MAG: YihY/virulence factor BrkB family protein, partial [Dehalococcoidia bacterium]|nr:YihY/virulence factor BrkB family protein [Dehalococcoidia bacterium]